MNSIGCGYDISPKRRNSMILILSVFMATYFIYTDFNVKLVIGYAILCAFLFALVMTNLYSEFVLTKTKKVFMFLASSTLIFLCMPGAKHDWDTASYMIVIVIHMLYFLFSAYDKGMVSKALTVLQITGVAIMLLLLFFRVFPDVYWSYMFPYLSEATKEEALRYIPKGYSIPMAGGYTYANDIFAVSFAVSAGQLFAGHNRKSGTILAWVSAAAAMIGMIMTGRRSEPLSLIVVFLIIAFIYRKKQLTPKKMATLLLLPVVIVAVFALLMFLGNVGFISRYINTFQTIFNNGGEGLDELLGGTNDITSGRMELWAIAVDKFRSAPIFGIGFFMFGDHVPAEFNAAHGRIPITDVHNDLLQHLCETGIVGTIFWILPMAYFLFSAINQAKRIRNRRDTLPPIITVLNTVSLATQLFYLVLGLIDPCFYHLSYWSFYTIGIICLEFSLHVEQSIDDSAAVSGVVRNAERKDQIIVSFENRKV